MTTIKSFTDISQSKKLAEILQIESADMCYPLPCEEGDKPLLEQGGFGSTPCWSLAALLGVLPQGYSLGNRKSNGKYYICMTCVKHDVIEYDEPIDACVEMIIKLHELKML